MKIIIKEEQLNRLVENVQYTPEKISEILNSAIKIQKIVKSEYEKQKDFIYATRIGTIKDDIGKFEKILSNLEEIKYKIENKYEFYFDVVNLYTYREMTNELNQLDDIVSSLDEYVMRFDDLIEILKVIIGLKK